MNSVHESNEETSFLQREKCGYALLFCMNGGRVMNRMIDSLGMLLLSCALLAVGNHLLNVLIPLRLNDAEVETLLIGVVIR
jgi:hypothetical protein